MNILNNFISSETKKIGDSYISFLKDENGRDWYEAQGDFSDESLKIVFDNNGLIVSMSYDVSTLWPLGNSVAEIALKDVPEGISNDGKWMYKNGLILPVPIDHLAVATKQRDSEMANATLSISELAEAQDDGDITDEEKQKLQALREYRSELRRLDISKAPDINWPISPA